MPDSILVLGATGRVGGATLAALMAAGERPLALARTEDRARHLPAGVEVRVADLVDREALAAAMASVDALLLCSGHAPDMEALQRNAIEAAAAAGVRRVVKISASPASVFEGTTSRVAAQHLELEGALAEASFDHTSIRPNAFAQLLAGSAGDIAAGELPLAMDDAAISWVDIDDIGAVAAAALRAEGSLPARIEVTGPEALDGPALAARVADRVGRPIAYRALSDAEVRARLGAAGAPGWLADHVVEIFALLRERGGDGLASGVEDWTGRPPTSVEAVLAREADALGLV